MNQKYIDKETNEQNFQDALINNDADGIWQAVFFTCQNICKSIQAKRGLRIKSVGFGLKEAKVEYEKVKDVIQHPRLYKSIKRSTIKAANSYISSKTDKIVDYTNIIRNSGVTIED